MPANDVPNLFGRDAELTRLRAALDRAKAGHGGVVLISGEAGIGKTALLERISHEAESLGFVVLTGRSYDLSVTPPYGPWIEVFASVPESERGQPLDRFDLDAEITSQDVLFRRAEAFLDGISGSRAMVVTLDDAHWADQASLDLLRFLGRRVDHRNVVIIAAYRSEEISRHHPLYALLPALVRESRAERLVLRPLDDSQIRAWIASSYRLSQPDEDRLVAYLAGNAGGNPFYASEMLRTVEEDRILSLDEGDIWTLADLASVSVPMLLQQVIDSRLTRLSPKAGDLLRIAAVIGHEAPFHLWGQVADEGMDALIDVVEEAGGIWLVTSAPLGDRFTFRHPLFREALYQSISLPRRRLVHLRVAELLAAAPMADPDAVAHHFQQAGDERAVEWLKLAGDRAWRAWAWTEAADRYQRAADALALMPNRAEERAWLLLRLAETRRYNAPRRALEHVAQAEEFATASQDVVTQAAVRWVRGRIIVADNGNGLPELEAAVAAMRTFDAASRQRYHEHTGFNVDHAPAILAVWLANLGRYTEALEASQLYLTTVLEADRLPLNDAEAYLAQGIAYGALGQPEHSFPAFQAALDIYVEQQDHLSIGHTAFLFLIEAMLPYRPDDLLGRARLVEIGDGAWEQAAQINITQASIVAPAILLLEGEWDRLREITGRTVGLRNYVRIWTAHCGAAVARHRGDPDLARAFVDAGLPAAPRFDLGCVWMSLTVQSLRLVADLAMDAMDMDAAERWTAAYDDLLSTSGRVSGRAEGALLRARQALLQERYGSAREHANRALAFANSPRQPLALLQTRRMLGEIALALGKTDEAAEHLAEAHLLGRACRAVLEGALTASVEARLAVARGDLDRAVKLFDEAAGTAAALKATPLLDRIELDRDLAESRDVYPDGLTRREVEVLKLVTEGCTDVEIAQELLISPRTVMTHVSNILGKTGAPSRAAAAAYAVRRGLA